MKTKVNDNCTGCEACVEFAPDVFEMNDEGLAINVLGDDADVSQYADDVEDAQENCPVEAIDID